MTLQELSRLPENAKVWYVFSLSGVPDVAAMLVAVSNVMVHDGKAFLEWEDQGETCTAVLEPGMADRSIHLRLDDARSELGRRLAELTPPPGWS